MRPGERGYSDRMASPKRLAALGAAALLGLAAGCQTTARHAAPVLSPQATRTLVEKADTALEARDCRTASRDYADAAQAAGSLNLARRASRVSITCQNFPAAWRSVSLWHALAPNDRNSSLVYGTIALSLYRIEDGRKALAPLVQGSGPTGERDQLSIIGLLSEDPDVGPGPTLAALGGTVHDGSPAVTLTAFGALALEAYDFKLAERRAQQVLAKDPRSLPALRLLARAQALEGNASGAIATAHKVLTIDPDGIPFELADVLTALNRFGAAARELNRLRGEGVPAAEIDNRLALLAYQRGDMADARRRFKALLDQGEGGGSAYLYLGDIAARMGDDYTALSDYRQLSESPLALTAGTRAAGVLLAEGQANQALGVFDSYESEHPENAVEVALAKAGVFASHGHVHDALTFIAAALDRFPQHPRLEYERASLLEAAGLVRESVAAFEKLLRERPGDPQVLNGLGYTLANHRLQLPRAESLIQRALAVAPDDPAMLDSLGWVRYQRGELQSAVATLSRAYRLSLDPDIAAHWGEALWASGAKTEARKVWAEALLRNPDSESLKETVHRLVPPGQG